MSEPTPRRELVIPIRFALAAVVDPVSGCASLAPPPGNPTAALASLITRLPAAQQTGHPTPHDGADRAATVAVAGGTAELQAYPSIAATARYLDTRGNRHPTHITYLQFGPWWTATTTDLDVVEVIANRLGGTTNRLSP